MIDRPSPRSPGITHDDPPQDLVEMVAGFDEDLRRGEVRSTAVPASADTSGGQELFDCLQLLERAWPRHPDAAASGHPQRIGKFEIERVVGQGGFGIVYLAHDTVLGRTVALKVPRLHTLTSRSLLERFHREARTAAALDHPHIVPVYEAGDDNGLCYIASAYCPGPTLAQWLRAQRTPVPPQLAAHIVAALADAVAYSHQRGIVHRDIKPSNVLLFPQAQKANRLPAGDDEFAFAPRLSDFGLAKILQDVASDELAGDDSAGAALLGTPAYMAPEQLERRPEAVGPAADLYALGVVLYELLAGRPPFVGSSLIDVLDQVRTSEPAPLRASRTDVPRDLEAICDQCLTKSPADRYAAAAALRDDLQRYLKGEAIQARDARFAHQYARWLRQHRASVLKLALGIAAIATIGALAWRVRGPAHASATPPPSPQVVRVANGAAAAAAAPLALGLVAAPADIPGVRSWRMITRGPRSVVQHDWSLSWSPDSRFVAFGDGAEVRIYAVPSWELIRVLDGHTNSVVCVAWSPDGREIASTSADNTIRLWDAATGVPGPVLSGHRARVNVVAWRPDSRQLASGGRDQVVRLWNRDGSTASVLAGDGAEIHSLAWSHDGQKLACGGEGSTIRIWDVGAEPPTFTAIPSKLRTRSLDWSRDDRQLLASHFYPTELRVWNVDGTQPLTLAHDDATVTGEWSPDSQQIVSGSWDNTVRLWSADGTAGPVLSGHDGNVCCVRWSPNGEWIASGGSDHSVRLWRKDGQPGPVLRGPPYLIEADWRPDGRQFAVGGGDHTLRICDANGEQQRVLEDATRPVFSLDWHPDGDRIVTGYTDGAIRAWDPVTGQSNTLLDPPASARTGGMCVRWSPDGRQLAAAGRLERNVQILSAEGAALAVLEGHRHVLYSASWNASGQQLASVSLDGTLRLWGADGTPGAVCNIGQLVASAAWCLDGGKVACGCEDGTIQFWDTAGRPGLLLKGHDDRAISLAWSTDGRWLASGSRDNTVRLWSTDGTLLHVLRGHAGTVSGVSWRPNAAELLSVGEDGIVRFWDAATGRPQWTLVILYDAQSVRLSPDGRVVAGDAGLIEREFVYVVEQSDRSTKVFAPSEFHALFQRND